MKPYLASTALAATLFATLSTPAFAQSDTLLSDAVQSHTSPVEMALSDTPSLNIIAPESIDHKQLLQQSAQRDFSADTLQNPNLVKRSDGSVLSFADKGTADSWAADNLAAGNLASGDTGAAAPIAAAAAGPLLQDASYADKRGDSYTVTLNQDSFFGFYPTFNGLIPIGDNVDFSFYGILWTNSGFSTVPGTDGDLWTEFGVGAAFYAADGNLIIKPQIGLTNGALLSGGVVDDAGNPTSTGGNFADGVVPSLTVNYRDESIEAEFYGGYYAALANRNDNAALDFLHTWANAGYRFTEKFSAGGHYELLSNTRNTFPGGSSAVVYQWLGLYTQFSLDNGFFARFSAGADIEDGNDGDFYKLTAGWTF